jgi:hypothetical protein
MFGKLHLFPSSGERRCHPPSWAPKKESSSQLLDNPCQNQTHITTDSQLASLSCCLELIWDPQPIFLLEIFFRQLRVCYFVAPSLTRGRVGNLLLLLLLASAVPLRSAPSDERPGLFCQYQSIVSQYVRKN